MGRALEVVSGTGAFSVYRQADVGGFACGEEASICGPPNKLSRSIDVNPSDMSDWWCHRAGKVLPGLVVRRETEAVMIQYCQALA
jgi:hypothetical protein